MGGEKIEAFLTNLAVSIGEDRKFVRAMSKPRKALTQIVQ